VDRWKERTFYSRDLIRELEAKNLGRLLRNEARRRGLKTNLMGKSGRATSFGKRVGQLRGLRD